MGLGKLLKAVVKVVGVFLVALNPLAALVVLATPPKAQQNPGGFSSISRWCRWYNRSDPPWTAAFFFVYAYAQTHILSKLHGPSRDI